MGEVGGGEEVVEQGGREGEHGGLVLGGDHPPHPGREGGQPRGRGAITPVTVTVMVMVMIMVMVMVMVVTVIVVGHDNGPDAQDDLLQVPPEHILVEVVLLGTPQDLCLGGGGESQPHSAN